MATELVFIGTSDSVSRNFFEAGFSIDMTNVYRILTTFSGESIVADTAVDPTLYEYGSVASGCDAGIIRFNFGELGLTGSKVATIKIYDLDHPNGQVIAHPSMNAITFTFAAA